MRPDIFAAFDPCCSTTFFTSLAFSMGPVLMLIILSMYSYWSRPSLQKSFFSFFFSFTESLSSRSTTSSLKGLFPYIGAILLTIVSINLSSLLPYVMSISSHLFFTVAIGFPMWLGLIMAGVVKDPYATTASLLPTGSPPALSPFLSIIETVSLMMRPITLTLRLAANMTAGHIILSLIGSFFSILLFITSSSSLIWAIHIMYVGFEVGVAIVQGLIFCVLLLLYSDDHPH